MDIIVVIVLCLAWYLTKIGDIVITFGKPDIDDDILAAKLYLLSGMLYMFGLSGLLILIKEFCS